MKTPSSKAYSEIMRKMISHVQFWTSLATARLCHQHNQAFLIMGLWIPKMVASNDTNIWPQTGWLGPTKENKQKRFCLCVFRFGNNGLKWSPNLADILGDTDFDFESFHFLIPCSQISRLHEFNIDRFLDYQIADSMLSARGNQSTALRHFSDSSGPQIGQALFLHVCCTKTL